MFVSGIIAAFAALCNFVVVRGDPTMNFKLDKVDVMNNDNALLGTWTATLTDKGGESALSMNMPAKADWPSDVKLKLQLTAGGTPLPDIDVEVCKALSDQTLGKDVVARGKPMPSACPIKKGDDWKFVEYIVNKNKLPAMPDGKLEAKMEVYVDDKPPMAIVKFEGTISHGPKIGKR